MRLTEFPQRTSYITYSIHIGGVFASREPARIRTVLGSCISVCLRDPFSGIGGMNHFMLPSGGSDEEASARYGIHAMELLINECMKAGADRRHFEAKVFGGGHVLQIQRSDQDVPNKNIRFTLDFLRTESIPILSKDLGGDDAREIIFHTDTGRTLLRRLRRSTTVERSIFTQEKEEQEKWNVSATQPIEEFSNVTLF